MNQKILKLEDYEEICPKCNGIGRTLPTINNDLGWICDLCYGYGYIDWIDKIKAKNEIRKI